MLKALIAHGGVKVPEQWVYDTLWGDDEADAARALGAHQRPAQGLLGRFTARH